LLSQIGIVMVCLGLSVASTWAAGLWLYELATPDMGTANAGRAALANDASTVTGNPAGMSRLDRSQLLLGLQGLTVQAEFDTSSSGFGGGDGGNAGDFVPAGGFHYVHSFSERFKAGVSAGSYFGLGLDYGTTWSGRYYVTEGDFVTLGVNPGLSYRVNDWFSVGAGFSVLYAELDQKASINNSVTDPGTADGKLEIQEDDVGYGFNLGVLVDPTEQTRLGLTYRSQVDVEFEDAVKTKGLGANLETLLGLTGVLGSKVSIEMSLPQAVMLSGYHELTPRWAVVANLGWQDWSEFGKSDIVVQSQDTTRLNQDRNFDDTWHVALGLRYRFADPWLWSAGIAYDSSPVDDGERTPDLPLDRQIRYATGVQYDWSADVSVGAAYEYLDAGDAKINQNRGPLAGELQGDYKTNRIHFLAANVIWRF
jgi:long-chain fatty acid transport protein